MSEEITDRFVGPNGEFQPTHEPPPGKITIEYLEELMEWTYYHNNITEEERKENIHSLEKMVEGMLNEMGINYVKTWSKKLEDR